MKLRRDNTSGALLIAAIGLSIFLKAGREIHIYFRSLHIPKSSTLMWVIGLVVLVGLIAIKYLSGYRLRKYINITRIKTKEHIAALCIKRKQTIYRDDYGVLIDKGYEKELNYFLVRVVAPAIGGDSWERFRPDLLNAIKSEIEINLAASNAHDFDDPVPSHPIHFEQWCVTRLTQSGWRARPTPASGDQGADVVATKDQTKIVVQCKLYQSTVGNKAVQEIAAARTHYEAHHALVVAPNGFTKAARQLAATNKVYLIHPDQLAQIDAVICGENP